MRTTLELDDKVLAVARSRALSQGISLGEAVSLLAEQGIKSQTQTWQHRDGIPVIPLVAGCVVTPEMVEEALNED